MVAKIQEVLLALVLQKSCQRKNEFFSWGKPRFSIPSTALWNVCTATVSCSKQSEITAIECTETSAGAVSCLPKYVTRECIWTCVNTMVWLGCILNYKAIIFRIIYHHDGLELTQIGLLACCLLMRWWTLRWFTMYMKFAESSPGVKTMVSILMPTPLIHW